MMIISAWIIYPRLVKKNSNQIKYCKSIPTYHLLSDYWPKLKVLSYNIWGMPELFNWYLDLKGYPKVEYKDERIQDLGRWSRFVQFSWILDHVIHLKLRRE